jgi:cysteine desulfurase
MNRPIYLDYAATTPVDPWVAEKMWQHLTTDGEFGNPASHTHSYGWFAQTAVEEARTQLAALVNANADDIIWTSGATESNNLAIKGAAHYYQKKGRHIVTVKTEHRAVLDVCRQLVQEGFEITYLDTQPNGLLDHDKVAAALRDDTLLLSVMHVNNEIGVIQDIKALGDLTRSRGILLHVDAAQSLGKVAIDLAALKVDLMSFSAHKCYGPKGVGALYIGRRPRVRLQTQLHGGGQERGLRAGTLATHQIVAMGEACRLVKQTMESENRRIRGLRDRLWQSLQDLQEIYLNGDLNQSVSGILNVSVNFVDGEALLMDLAEQLAVSSGSACTSATQQGSHVLRALGRSETLARSAIRFSLGRFTTLAEIEAASACVHQAIHRLRALSPLWEEYQKGTDLAGLENLSVQPHL